MQHAREHIVEFLAQECLIPDFEFLLINGIDSLDKFGLPAVEFHRFNVVEALVDVEHALFRFLTLLGADFFFCLTLRVLFEHLQPCEKDADETIPAHFAEDKVARCDQMKRALEKVRA